MKGMYEFFRQKSIIGKSTLPPAGRRRMHVLPYRPPAFRKTGKAGPVPFAPAEIEKRLAPEEILADTKSIAVILFPYRYPEEKNSNIALYARAKDYHHVVRAYLAKIIGYMEEQYPDEKFHAITDTSPMADRWLAYQAGLGFSAGTTASSIRSTVLTLPSEPY